MCEEMIKFRKILDENKIEWKDMSETWPSIVIHKNVTVNRTNFYIDDVFVSVVNGYGTNGGCNTFTMKNHGLLEMWILDINKGYLTASDCWEEIKKILKKAEPAHDRK